MSFVFCCFATLLRFANTFDVETSSTKSDCDYFEMLQDFGDHELLYHYDNATPVDCFLHVTKRVTLLFNYDSHFDPVRPLGRKYLDVVHLGDPERFQGFTERDFNVEYVDVVFMVVRENKSYQRRFGKRLTNAGGLFLYETVTKQLFYVKYYYGNLTGVAVLINKRESLPKYVNNFHQFNGHQFKIGYIPYKPFVSCP